MVNRVIGTGILGRLRAAYSRSGLAQLFSYMGPAVMVSIAYMDPGNYGTDIQGGSSYNYDLLWVGVACKRHGDGSAISFGKVGIATGRSLPELMREKLCRKAFIIPYWLAAEAATAATDLAEYLGTVIALNLLFGVPMFYASIFGAADVLVIMTLATRKFRMVERMFMLFVSIIGVGYLYEIFLTNPTSAPWHIIP